MVPHFDVTTVEGRRVRYRELWQRRNLILAALTPDQRDIAAHLSSALESRRGELDEAEAVVVVTADEIPGLPAPQVVIADRWGEIVYRSPQAAPTGGASPFPDVDELLSWVRFIRMQCPECPP